MITSRIVVEDHESSTTIRYALEGHELLRDALHQKTMHMELESIEAVRAATKQSVKVRGWKLEYRGDRKVLDGDIALDVVGGTAPYSVTFRYAESATPNLELACH